MITKLPYENLSYTVRKELYGHGFNLCRKWKIALVYFSSYYRNSTLFFKEEQRSVKEAFISASQLAMISDAYHGLVQIASI